MASTGISDISQLYQAPITFSGLGSSVDFQSIITKLEKAESYRINQLTAWKGEWTDKITALQTLNSKLSDFKTAVEAMDTPAEFQAKTAASSNTGVLTAQAATTAATGSHQVLVQRLAQNDVQAHQGVSAATTVINSSGGDKVFAFSYAGGGPFPSGCRGAPP
jgi:flagellar hook-associated protein 2